MISFGISLAEHMWSFIVESFILTLKVILFIAVALTWFAGTLVPFLLADLVSPYGNTGVGVWLLLYVFYLCSYVVATNKLMDWSYDRFDHLL